MSLPTRGAVMSVTIDRPVVSSPTRRTRRRTVTVTQYSRRAILAIWAAAALPMGVLAWIVAPAIANHNHGAPWAGALLVCLTAGLIWQFVLVVALVGYEQRSLRWSRLRPALWLGPPRSPRTGRVGGWVWLAVLPFIVGFGVRQLIPAIPAVANRDFGTFLASHAGKTMFHGSWGWFAVVATMLVFNTVLGEELLFRGLLLPRMHDAFGDRDWVANGVLFACYHLHLPWVIPVTLLDTFLIAYPTKRYRSAWMGIAVHSAQTVFFAALVLALVV
jgi:membrane protease YdiL (CAAX protease family)